MLVPSVDFNRLGRTSKVIPPPWYKGGRGWNPSPEFLICCSILKRFYLRLKARENLSWSKAFDLVNKMRYVLWVVALLEACELEFA